MVDRELVEGWLTEAGLDYESVEAEPEYAWALSFQTSVFATIVAHPPVSWNKLLMQVSVTVASEHRQLLSDLDNDTRDRFIHDLRIALLQRPVGFAVETDEASGIPERLVFVLNLMEEPLQRSGFFRRNHQLMTAGMLASEMFRKLARFQVWA